MTHTVFDNLISSCTHFIKILSQETELLNANNIAEANALLKEKQYAADLHHNACTLFEAENALAQCTAEELKTLKETIDLLHHELLANKTAIDLAYKIRTSIIDKISAAVKEQQAPVCHYTKSARFSTNTSPVSMLALNRQI
ncbi:MAG: hypothetical protein KF798_04050 [Candidatus Paracaedibacteraceae bacterium]|nr:hypothetical protein [Candidatus Paracaedibacteraceae bacterium]